METSLQLEKYEQELELIQGLNKLAIQENDDTVKEYQSKISQLQDVTFFFFLFSVFE